jgi:hypothetical protein
MKCQATDESGHSWAGWHRLGAGRRWAKVCTGPTWAECWGILVGTTEGGDLTVLPAGQDPHRRGPVPAAGAQDRG